MLDSGEPELPDDARTVLVLSSATTGSEACTALAGRGERVLLVGYAGTTAEDLRERLAGRFEEPPPVRALDVGGEVELSDLTGQGITVAEALSPETTVCFDSLGALLQYTDLEQVFQFVHSLAERCAASSATMHVHLDPAAVDDRAVAALSTLADAVVDVEAGATTLQPELTGKD
ncbi:hypothetical protein BRC99_04035 [Halobacteriales archaeon QS_7_69_60]|nr:MAG: hypothetical protein BRC99_04035 [Halobacteriales archaeon QS_7_69_60]